MKISVIENNVVVNLIVADSIDTAEQLTGKTCVEVTPVNIAYINETYDPTSGLFIPKQPYPSWVLNGNMWVAPVPYPEVTEITEPNPELEAQQVPYIWDEKTVSWIHDPVALAKVAAATQATTTTTTPPDTTPTPSS